jgi:hypothetical protein
MTGDVVNVHEREIPVPAARAGALIGTLASSRDALWPVKTWPRMTLDRPLGIGAAGGHGPIRYVVEDYIPGRFVRFRFTRPRGFRGYHEYEALGRGRESAVLRHTIRMTLRGAARLSWPLLYRPLHDALLEDSLAAAEAALGIPPRRRPWSAWVKLLRRALAAVGPRAGAEPGRAVQENAGGPGAVRDGQPGRN